jgi:long-chain acyl-CoA synthetase
MATATAAGNAEGRTAAAPAEVRTINDLLAWRIAKTPEGLCYASETERVTWRGYGERVDALAMALIDLGLKPGGSVAVMGQTTGEWAIADLAILAAGGVSVGIYPTVTAEQAAYILNDCGATIAIAGSLDAVRILEAAKKTATGLSTLIAWGDGEDAGGVLGWSAQLARGATEAAGRGDELAARKPSRGPDDTALLVYTSGTTGVPKGAMLSHGNCVFELEACTSLIPMGLEDDMTVSFLPMAHVAEHLVGFYGRIQTGVGAYYVGSLESERILDALQTVRPTLFGSVPRIFEKAYGRIQNMVADANPRRQAIFRWAEGVGRAWSRHHQAGTEPPLSLRLQHKLADALVFRKIRARFGGRVRYFICGAAPIDIEILEFFHAAGLHILEAYGLTECSAIATINRLEEFKFGTVGKPIPGVEVRIADDGEVLIRGPNVFQGYLNLPDETAEAIDDEGWLHTGDIGVIEDEGWLKITDRKKNLIITAGGKNIAPAGIESLLASEPVLGPVVIIGDRRPYLTALVSLDPDAARQVTGRSGASVAELADDAEIVGRVRAAFARANGQLARYEHVRRVRILPRELSIAEEEITPTMKIRRKVVAQRWASEIEGLYAGTAEAGVLEVDAAGE